MDGADGLPAEIKSYGQTILVLQGGGALGAYQVGVFEALAEAGIEPDWVIGTSIGAINAAIIAGNAPADRMERLDRFWAEVEQSPLFAAGPGPLGALGEMARNASTMFGGLRGFFRPNPLAFLGPLTPLGPERAGYYSTDPLRRTLAGLIDFDRIARGAMRLTVGAASVEDSRMHYFDSSDPETPPLGLEHVMASGALPPAFPAVRIGDQLFWDGGILSNTPIEQVFDTVPRRNAMIFTVQLWNGEGEAPTNIWEVMNRQKDVQYSSRVDSHIARHRQLHRLRHIISDLAAALPADLAQSPEIGQLTAWGCTTRMHIVRLLAPNLPNENHLKDIDFSPAGLAARRTAGYAHTRAALLNAPWRAPFDPREGLILHDVCGGEPVAGDTLPDPVCGPPSAAAAR